MNKGLSDIEVIEFRKKYGTNEIISKKQNSFINLLIESFGDPMIKILLVALAIKIVFLFKDFDFFETLGIIIAILLSTFISSISEYGSNKAFEKLESVNDNIKIKVLRNNVIKEIFINDIVVNDIIILESGDKIGADGILIEGELSVDESILNGESKESKKNIYKNNKLYRGTTVYFGYGKMKVMSVGNNTMYGKIAMGLHNKEPISPLKSRLIDLAKVISRIGYIGAFLVTIAYLFSKIVISNHYDINLIKNTICNIPLMINYLIYALTLSVTIIVVAVPEGLPMMITLVLSSNMKKMLKDKVLVRKLVGIETAGNINILLTDKTGTITKGKLEVIDVLTSNFKSLNKQEIINNNLFCNSIVYNNDSFFSDNDILGGNITDQAILRFIGNHKKNKDVKNKIHFNSKIKYSIITIDNITYYKGALEVLLPKCNKIYINNKGIRVITLTYKKNNNYVLLGFIYLKDEIRDEAYTGIDLIKKAGIDIIMITGDSKETAYNIASEVGIINNKNDLVIDSLELNKLSDKELKNKIKNIKVISRALPEDKSRLVKVIEDMNLVVGMTGDGVNDAPALKQSNVGFAMGSGTEVAKEASDIIILDDNILSISKAILYGRTIFKSIRKFIIYQLSVNMCALILSIIGPFIGFSSPITIVQMLWLNMIMDTFSAIAFSYEPALLEYMEEPPKNKNEKIMNSYMYNEIIITSLYSSIMCILFLKLPIIKTIFRIGENNKYLMTAYFALFIFLGIFNSFNARTYRINIFSNIFKNKVFMIIITFIIIVQIYLIYYGGDIFRTYGLTSLELFIIILLSSSIIIVDIIRKSLLKKLNLK